MVTNQSKWLAITHDLLKAREKVVGAIGFGLASRWFKNWREIFEPIMHQA